MKPLGRLTESKNGREKSGSPLSRGKHMHEPQIGKENLHIVPERKNGSPQEKSWVIVTERLPACCVSNNNVEPSA